MSKGRNSVLGGGQGGRLFPGGPGYWGAELRVSCWNVAGI